jgi:TolA-binding protein
MAKICNNCKQSYPDDQHVCPHCAAADASASPAKHDVDWDEVLDQPAGAPGSGRPASDSGIDLGAAPEVSGGSMSGISAVDWASLVEEPAPRTGDAQAAVDSPSDSDLRAQAALEPATLPPTRPAAAEAPPPEEAPQAPAGPPPAEEPPAPEVVAAAQEPPVVEVAPTADESPVAEAPPPVETPPPAAPPVLTPSAGLASEQEMARDLFPEEEQAIDLGAAPPAGSGVSSVKIAHAVDDAAAEVVADATAPEPEVDSSGIELGELHRPLSESPSAVQRAEEEVLAELEQAAASSVIDSGPASGSSVDLGSLGHYPHGGPHSGESGVDLLDLPPSSTRLHSADDIVDPFDSSIEGTAAPLSGPLARKAPDSGVELDDALDLESPPAPPQGESPSGRDLIAEAVESGVDLDMPVPEPGEPRPTDRLSQEPEPVVADLGAEVPDMGPESSAVDLSRAEVDIPSSRKIRGEVPRAPKPSTQEAIDLEGLPAMPSSISGIGLPAPSPSAVDLGSRPEVREEAPAVPADSDVEVEEAEAIDLEMHAARAPEEPSSGSLLSQTVAYETGGGDQPPVVEEEVVAEEPSVVEEAEEPSVVEEPTAAGEEAVVAEEPIVEEAVAEEPEAVDDEPAVEEEGVVGEEVAVEEPEDGATVAEEEGQLVGAAVGGDDDTVPAAAKAPRPRSSAGAWFGGGFLGLLVGAGAVVGLSFAGIEPWRTASAPPTKPVGPPPKPEAQVAAERRELVSRGDYDKAREAGIEQANELDKQQLAARGEYRWFSYLQKHGGGKVDGKAKEVQEAISDLTTADTPEAVLVLGHIQELTDPAKAEETYTSAANKFKDNPEWKRRFEKLSSRARVRAQPPDGDKGAWLTPHEKDLPALAVWLLIALQDPPPATDKKPDAKAPDNDEAGFDFWDALKLAQGQDYKGALDALDKARKLHEQRRLQNLRKPQNPLSDPTEEIFLRSCDQIKAYWNMQAKLKDGGYKSFDAVLTKATEGEAASKLVKDLGEKLVKEEIIKKSEDLDNGVTQLLSDRKEAETKVAAAEKMIKTLKTETADLSEKLKKTGDDLKDRDDQLKKEKENLRVAKADLATEQAMVEKIMNDLAEAKYLDKKAGKAGILQGLRAVLRLAAVVDPKGLLRSLEERVDRDETALKERWKPQEMLGFWLPLLEANRDREDLAEDALADARRVQRDETATPADRARADIIRGLALRNEEKFADSRAALEKGLGALSGDRGPFISLGETALRMVENPGKWFASQVATLQQQGKSEQAMEFLSKALKNMPEKEQAALLAQRSLLELDAARSAARDGPIPLTDANLIAARKDAAAAARAGVGEGFYAAGRIAEELGRWDDAVAAYRKAVDAHPDLDAIGARYRVSLARALVQPREIAPPAARPTEEEEKGKKAAAVPADIRSLDAGRLLALLFTVALQDTMEEPTPAQQEAEKLADDVLKAGDAIPFDVRAQALAVKGRWTAALNTFAEGLRGHLPAAYSQALLSIVRNHPRLRPPDGQPTPNPLEAEKHYSAGVNFYFDRDYQSAEQEFAAAVDNDSQDARYYYFLALSRLMQGKRQDAAEDLDRGALLERAGRPAPGAVSEALERVQGPARRIVNEARSRPR